MTTATQKLQEENFNRKDKMSISTLWNHFYFSILKILIGTMQELKK